MSLVLGASSHSRDDRLGRLTSVVGGSNLGWGRRRALDWQRLLLDGRGTVGRGGKITASLGNSGGNRSLGNGLLGGGTGDLASGDGGRNSWGALGVTLGLDGMRVCGRRSRSRGRRSRLAQVVRGLELGWTGLRLVIGGSGGRSVGLGIGGGAQRSRSVTLGMRSGGMVLGGLSSLLR